ncbi:AAA family ATPase [Mycoplasma sp. 744]|uniref:AAA family ATPase n=1 Tax=Mycoplasma sp. 744 TaxID=3108531 RepID=UPI002B1DF43F|nr:AAA family ATPase [Mycoplasma sp. 744]MEA4115565.1 AAA family ATPase [Mycoplasma sp. 744]
MIDSFELEQKQEDLKKIVNEYDKIVEEIKSKNEEINELKENIKKIDEDISKLKTESKNEEKLALEINKILDVYVNFSLNHVKEEDQKGYYNIKDKYTGEIRNVSKLSTGEKNIIGFLYFLFKLKDIEYNNFSKIVIFDDPMNSNDMTMQYIIIEQLKGLIDNINKDDSVSNLIILTHNHLFYLNLTTGLSYKKYNFFRLISDGKYTKLKIIEKKENDFSTLYEGLWMDLILLYKTEQVHPEIMCNICRRIIETYIKFNRITKSDFYKNVTDAKKLFDVNSHDIEDIYASSTGITKENVIDLLRKCFNVNGDIDHFNKYWLN